MPTPPAAPVAFVTGGTGFVGSHLVEALLDRGFTVRALVRSRRKWLAGLNVDVVRGDLSDVEALWEGVQGADYVFHLAGRTQAPTYADFHAANVTGTLNLLGTIRQAAPDVQRVLITSSLAAVGRGTNGVATEDTPLEPVSRYGRSKAAMEEALRDSHDLTASYAEALPLTVVRPPAVYGPRDRDILTFFQAVQKGVCPVVGRGSTPALSLVYVDDLVDGIIRATLSDAAVDNTYFLGSPAIYSWNDVKEAATAALDRSALTVPVPPLLVGAVGWLAEGWSRLTGQSLALDREKAREIRYACKQCSSEKAKRAFNYAPAVDIGEGVRRTIAWYTAEGWL
ncbi:NAD-dependent epimerase/dehydratase family protein [Salisaeta longa]|uniref:NAD-dependent epimerase/dehydratase family protein n=1 Tax=Salisaeta longa TaxID=503170 RepID=UPI0003B56667|nr:NAD-dependent epimerase/dehydratase family protein [Salisaeta longa]